MEICPVQDMKILLNCPRSIIDQSSLRGKDLVDTCKGWLQDNHLGIPPPRSSSPPHPSFLSLLTYLRS